MFSTQADTIMLFHAVLVNKEFGVQDIKGAVTINFSDIDVFVLALHYYPTLHRTYQLWVQMGKVTATTDLRRRIAVHD